MSSDVRIVPPDHLSARLILNIALGAMLLTGPIIVWSRFVLPSENRGIYPYLLGVFVLSGILVLALTVTTRRVQRVASKGSKSSFVNGVIYASYAVILVCVFPTAQALAHLDLVNFAVFGICYFAGFIALAIAGWVDMRSATEADDNDTESRV